MPRYERPSAKPSPSYEYLIRPPSQGGTTESPYPEGAQVASLGEAGEERKRGGGGKTMRQVFLGGASFFLAIVFGLAFALGLVAWP